MTNEEKKFDLYLTVLRFLAFSITPNLRRIYLDIDLDLHKMYLTAYYSKTPSELELELLDDIETNSQAHIPDFLVYTEVKVGYDYNENVKHDFVVFAVYEEN
ncbi:hypothetical protein [Mucilaginibacter pocheonensis]|uniref:PD-(D/E)XK nuclease superfamily protein n=1 Tax=Mucilaginibacter pocheonensis TaxID=398050 RepID=A0ABU1T9L1_9SPHI|nr:hypothetical protein [Mucilaginibacter pocheonensis]MDR6942085.1 hypothetical protein [Mucilaginibacter pocheonensis]